MCFFAPAVSGSTRSINGYQIRFTLSYQAEEGMDVSKTDCGGITDPGEYEFRDGHLIVTPHQMAIWNAQPDAIFTAVESRLSSGLKLYVLASWRLPATSRSHAPVNDAGMSPH
ncbi:MAG: hypothetical protein ABWY14_12060 [Tardiphaga sp.]